MRPRLKYLILPLLLTVMGSLLAVTSAAPADAADCPRARIFGVRGSGEKATDAGGYGRLVDGVIKGVIAANPGVTSAPINYPAVEVGYGGLGYGFEYERSVQAGRVALATAINKWVNGDCGAASPVLLVGWSQGAHVIADVYQDWLLRRSKSRVLGIVLLGEPRFKGGQATPVNRGNYDRRLNGVYDIPGTPRTWAAADGAVVRSYCTARDPICNFTPPAAAACRISPYCPHAGYDWLPSWRNTYTAQAVTWLTSRLPSAPPPPTPDPKLTVGPLTMIYPRAAWAQVDYGASGPGQDSSADDTTNKAACTNCDVTPPPQVPAFLQVFNMSWCSSDVLACAIGDAQTTGTVPDVTIGGRTPDASARYLDSGYTGTSMMWCFSAEQVCVAYRRGTDAPQLEPSQAMRDLFATATWGP